MRYLPKLWKKERWLLSTRRTYVDKIHNVFCLFHTTFRMKHPLISFSSALRLDVPRSLQSRCVVLRRGAKIEALHIYCSGLLCDRAGVSMQLKRSRLSSLCCHGDASNNSPQTSWMIKNYSIKKYADQTSSFHSSSNDIEAQKHNGAIFFLTHSLKASVTITSCTIWVPRTSSFRCASFLALECILIMPSAKKPLRWCQTWTSQMHVISELQICFVCIAFHKR